MIVHNKEVLYARVCKTCHKQFKANHPRNFWCSQECKITFKSPKNVCKCGCGKLCKNKYVHGHNPLGFTPERNKKISDSRKNKFKVQGFLNSEETCKKIGIAGLGRVPWNKNKTKQTDSRLIKTSETSKKKIREGKHGAFTKEAIEKRITTLKKTLRDHPEIVQKCCSSNTQHPNGLEKKLLDIIIENKLPLRWVGNGKFWITHCGKNHNPDFIAEKPINLVIEVFADTFKIWNHGSIKNYIKYRKMAFVSKGFDVAFFNYNSFVDSSKALNKLQRYLNKHSELKM